MGTWGYASWENDQAADWFGVMFKKTHLADYVEKTLELNPEEHPDEIRAAAHVLSALGRHYIWPSERLDAYLKLAIEKLEKVKQVFSCEDPDGCFASEIDSEISILKTRFAVTHGT